jgi:cytochrome c-type biogenesis protein CcmH/NrfG
MYARTLVVLKRYREARDRLHEARRAHPGDPELIDLLVRILAAAPDDQLRDGRRAMSLMQELLKSSPPRDARSGGPFPPDARPGGAVPRRICASRWR